MAMYCGIDLHSNNNYVAILDESCRTSRSGGCAMTSEVLVAFLEPYREELEVMAVESTFNWYWLVDGLNEAGYDVRLVNTTKASDYSGMKYTDDGTMRAGSLTCSPSASFPRATSCLPRNGGCETS